MLIKDLKHHYKTIREEVKNLPNTFISEKPRKEGEWVGSEHLKDVVTMYASGKHGWLKGGQDHVAEEWISWPLVWDGHPVIGNCEMCPKTHALLSSIKGIKVAGFSLMKGGVKLKLHTDDVGPNYKFTYHLGIDVPFGYCILHHSKSGDVIEENGKHIVLDARKPHWAENLSDEDRIILYMEINQ
jgi:aspartyl/asparaginyl beta-hydroxylase (cupin superfamily)